MFVLDYDPVLAATYYIDKHVVKIPLELAQVVCTVFWKNDKEVPYRPTHKNHPLTLWAGESLENINWLFEHGFALGEEYTKRYNKVHKSTLVLKELSKNLLGIDFRKEGMTDFALCMPEEYIREDAVESYRSYYMGSKRAISSWKTEKPFWWV